jgi:heterogeneous nuclear rnp K-like protein 2
MPGQPLTQQIFIPNDMVGAIIGKGGAKINEIRQLSGSVIKINEPTDNSNERLVTISGTQECNQMALYMLYSRLGQYNDHTSQNKANVSHRIGKAPYLGTCDAL